MPQRPRHEYAAGLPGGLLAGVNDRHQSRPQLRACAAAQPISTRLEPALPLRALQRWSLTSTFPSCLPGPDRLAVPTRPVVVGAAPTLPCTPRVGLPPASPACCDRLAAGPFHPCPIASRLVAHDHGEERRLLVPPATEGHRNVARAIPLSVCRSSGSSVRLPAKLTLASVMILPLPVAWPGGLPCPWNRGTVDTVACRESTRGQATEPTKSADWINRQAWSARVPGW